MPIFVDFIFFVGSCIRFFFVWLACGGIRRFRRRNGYKIIIVLHTGLAAAVRVDDLDAVGAGVDQVEQLAVAVEGQRFDACLLYTSDAADE